jgi:hypothetical protein
MATGKNYSIVHTPGDVTHYCEAINISCEHPEKAHKTWVKEQGICTNQGPHAASGSVEDDVTLLAQGSKFFCMKLFKVFTSMPLSFSYHTYCALFCIFYILCIIFHFLHILHLLYGDYYRLLNW